jgi:putative ABC transport system substrate-binding protein
MRRIGVLMLYPESDPQGQLRATAFRQGLEKLGWVVGRNVQIDFQWGLGDADWIRSAAAQLLGLAPDVILANGTPAAKTMQQASRAVAVIFIASSDPVLDGLVPSLARPGGNLTGFYVFEPSLPAKLLELLKEIAPHVTRVAMLTNPDANPASWFASAVAAAPRFAVEVEAAPLRGSNEIEAAMVQWGREQNFGLIVVPDPATNAHRKLINDLAARYRLPVIHALRRRCRWRPDILRCRPSQPVPTVGGLCRSHPQGCQPGRPADLPANQVRAGDQSHIREGPRYHCALGSDGARRRVTRLRQMSDWHKADLFCLRSGQRH